MIASEPRPSVAPDPGVAPPLGTAPRVSVAMSVYNNAPFLPQAIESILGQTFADFEFLIVDDGSTDGSGAIIDGYAARDGRVRPIHQANAGLVVSLNRLLREARAPLVARMDGDDVSLPLRFERQVAFLDAHPDHGVVGTWSPTIDEAGHRLEHVENHPATNAEFLAKLGDGPPLCHPSVMMRRDLVLEAGGYRAAFRHCEDYDLWLRLSERTKICSVPEELLLYRYSATQVSTRHVLEQQTGAAVAWAAHEERLAGRPDPIDRLDRLPAIDALDAVFGHAGVSRAVRARVAPTIVYSPGALRAGGYDIVMAHLREGGSRDGSWRTVARLLKFGEPVRALRLAAALALP